MTEEQITGYLDKLKEAITKFQGTLPKQLPREGIDAIMALMNEWVKHELDMKWGQTIPLFPIINSSLINAARGEHTKGNDEMTIKCNKNLDRIKSIVASSKCLSNITEAELAENIPFLCVTISENELKICNHERKYLYDSSGSNEIVDRYNLKSHAQFEREVTEASKNEGKVPDDR